MRRIRFVVLDELPPKKGGRPGSMWNKNKKPSQTQRLIALRKAAHQALGTEQRFTKEVALKLAVCVGEPKNGGDPSNRGDLDTWIAGVCDGLCKAKGNVNLDPSFDSPENAHVKPLEWSALRDDGIITKIVAEKHVGPGPSWYRVEIEGVEASQTGGQPRFRR